VVKAGMSPMCAITASMLMLLAGVCVAGVDQEIVALDDGMEHGVDDLVELAEGVQDSKISVAVRGKSKLRPAETKYVQIPNFVLRHMGEEQKVRNQMACERICSSQKSCLSFSFRAKDRLCVWSIEALHYRYDWVFYTKVHELNAFGKWKHGGKYRSFPGIMYQEPGYKRFKGKTVAQCQKLCTKDEKCKAFSYHEGGERCYMADSGIHYDPQFMYFEKAAVKKRKSASDLEDRQEELQKQEKDAKKGKRDRILASMKKREKASKQTETEMRNKRMTREMSLKKKNQKVAKKRLKREKTLESRDKRLARMKAAYNEGYFKAKGVAAEKKTKEKDIKALRKKENAEKMSRVVEKKLKKRQEIKKKKNKKIYERNVKKSLVKAKEKLVKIKNNEIETEIAKEKKVLDVAKNLVVSKTEVHEDEVAKDKAKRAKMASIEQKKMHEMKVKTTKAKEDAKKQAKVLEKLKNSPGQPTNTTTPATPTNKKKADKKADKNADKKKKKNKQATMKKLL